MIGINVVLNTPPSAAILAQLEEHGQIRDVITEIKAVALRANAIDLPVIQALPCVAAANPDVQGQLAGVKVPVPDFANGAGLWNLDAINVTDFGTTRTVSYDGAGVYIAVLDTGLPPNWREYFPEERIAEEFATAFGGGGGDVGRVTAIPEEWQRDTDGHGTRATSVLLGFSYYGTQSFNGVAPRATVIPVRVVRGLGYWSSVLSRAIVYVANLKTSGALGSSPAVISMSLGGPLPDAMSRAAIDYAIAQGIVVVVAAGNEGAAGMSYPGAYPEVISVGASGWVREWPVDDPTTIWWILRDVLENDLREHFIWSESSRALPGQDLDLVAPGYGVPTAYTSAGQADYNFWQGTSASCPHVAGVAALMLQKNPGLSPSQIESILESTAMPLAPGCRGFRDAGLGPGNPPTWSDHNNVFFFAATTCWGVDAAGHGLLRADAALNATPLP